MRARRSPDGEVVDGHPEEQMSYGKPEKICRGERPGYRTWLKRKAAKARRLSLKRGAETVRVAMRGWSV
jgi:hypothetical protein